MEKLCKYCGRIIVEDYEKWLEENPETRYLQCCYCSSLELIKWE